MAQTVLIALARGVCRDGLHRFLDSVAGVSVVGDVPDGRSAVDTAREVRPDIVILETHLPELNGVEATRQLVAADPRVAVIFMAASADPPVVARILRAGARGFVLTDGGLTELREALRTVMDGHVYLPSSVEDRVISSLDSYSNSAAGLLTAREREVLQLIAEGKPTRQIASILGVSTKTIETHRMRLMDKLKIRSVAGLTKYAIRNGLTSVT